MGLVQQDVPQAHPPTSLLPFRKPSLTGWATPESQSGGGGAPRQIPPQDVQDAIQGIPGGNPGASTAGTGEEPEKNMVYEVPESPGNQRFDHCTLVQPYIIPKLNT